MRLPIYRTYRLTGPNHESRVTNHRPSLIHKLPERDHAVGGRGDDVDRAGAEAAAGRDDGGDALAAVHDRVAQLLGRARGISGSQAPGVSPTCRSTRSTSSGAR